VEQGSAAAQGSDSHVTGSLSRTDAERLARLLQVVSEPTRLQLLSMIRANPRGEACVTDLAAPLGLTQPTVSYHLKVLVQAGLLRREKRGLWAWYSLVPEALEALAGVIR
jgi:ArsR family transcriptional regulator, arsenate/arsenite/antimonite-responsive transcriptional repressor